MFQEAGPSPDVHRNPTNTHTLSDECALKAPVELVEFGNLELSLEFDRPKSCGASEPRWEETQRSLDVGISWSPHLLGNRMAT